MSHRTTEPDRVVYADQFGVRPSDGTDQSGPLKWAMTQAVSGGGRLVIPPGEYLCSDVNVPAGCHIVGFGAATTLRRAPGAARSRVLVITGSDVVIEGLTIDGDGEAAGVNNDGLVTTAAYVGLSGITIRDCTLLNAHNHAIRLPNTAGDVHIVGCRIVGYSASGTQGHGVSMNSNSAGAPTTIRNVEVSGCTIVRHAVGDGHGIQVRGSDDNATRIMEDVRIVGNHCDLSNGITKGCIESWADHAVISANTCLGGNMGISNGRSHVAITGNSIHGTDGNGIEATAGAAVNVSCAGNTIEDTVIGISAWGLGLEVSMMGNTIKNVSSVGINANSKDSVCVGNRIECAPGALYGVDLDKAGGTSDRQVISNNYVKMDAATSSTVGVRIQNCAEFVCDGNLFVDCDTGVSLSGTSVAKNGTVVGNNFTNATTPISVAGTVGNIQRWANRGVLPSRQAYASTDALLIDHGVIVA